MSVHIRNAHRRQRCRGKAAVRTERSYSLSAGEAGSGDCMLPPGRRQRYIRETLEIMAPVCIRFCEMIHKVAPGSGISRWGSMEKGA